MIIVVTAVGSGIEQRQSAVRADEQNVGIYFADETGEIVSQTDVFLRIAHFLLHVETNEPLSEAGTPHAAVVVAEKFDEIQTVAVVADVTGHTSAFKVEDMDAYAADPQSVQGVERQ